MFKITSSIRGATVLFLVAAVAGCATIVVLAQNSSTAEIPVADFKASLPTEDPARTLREARNTFFNDPREALIDPADPTYSIRAVDRQRLEEPPHQKSDTIVLGTVETSRAFVATDRRGLYSEFEVRVTSVIKDVNTAKRMGPVAPGDRLTAVRRGGAVRLPSGDILQRLVRPGGFPSVAQDYILFLKREPMIEAFTIVGGYHVKESEIEPLDDGWEYPGYAGMALDEFLTRLRQMIERVN